MSQFYIGTKKIFAWPERRNEHDGYHVVYQYGLPNEYHSWSPKAEFESAYVPMGHGNDNKVTQEMVDAFILCWSTRTEGKTAIVCATLVNGFEIVESSSCVDPANYDERMGEGIALKRIKERIWNLLGFALQWGSTGILRLPEPPEA